MIIYGLMLMGLCMFAGLIVGDLLGLLLGISANIGGVGFAMLFLVVISQKLTEKGLLSKPAEQGVGFWNAMYIPIVVAMSANQNVVAALKGGPVALIAGLGAVVIGFLLIKPLSKIGSKSTMTSSAIAIAAGLLLAWLGGELTGGKKGLSDITLFSGIALMGGGMFRDFAIIATAFGVKLDELKKAGLAGALALVVSTVLSFYLGAIVAWAFGYTDAVSMATIGGGAVTFIVGPVTGAALGASSDVIALSIAAGVIKSIAIMIVTPLVAKAAGLNSPAAAIVYGGLMGSTSGVAAGLAATDPKLVPYGAMTATFYTGLGCLLAPSALYISLAPFF